jgi:hypothetical protein
MSVYSLRNGLSIDLQFAAPQVLAPGPADFVFEEGSLYKSYLNARPHPIDANGTTFKHLNVVRLMASGRLSGASADVFEKSALRFIQFIQVKNFAVQYFGKRPDDGGLQWQWTGQLLLRNIDSLYQEKGKINTSPYQFTMEQSEHVRPDKLIAKLGDTPNAAIRLSERNRESKSDNYLHSFLDHRTFESIVTFVHPDGSFQMLESCKWSFRRVVTLKWVKLRPEFTTNHINFTADKASTPVFGRDAEYAETLSSGRIANRLSLEAYEYSTSPHTSFQAVAKPNIYPSETFWSP